MPSHVPFLLRAGVAAFALFASASLAAATEDAGEKLFPPENVSVALDLATVVRVPAGTRTLVIGNPAIADAAVQKNGLLVITGKSYGATNLLVLNDAGDTLRDIMINVQGPGGGTLIVQRGLQRETYSCSPRCEQTLTPGDADPFFGAANTQTGTRNSLAQGSAGH